MPPSVLPEIMEKLCAIDKKVDLATAGLFLVVDRGLNVEPIVSSPGVAVRIANEFIAQDLCYDLVDVAAQAQTDCMDVGCQTGSYDFLADPSILEVVQASAIQRCARLAAPKREKHKHHNRLV